MILKQPIEVKEKTVDLIRFVVIASLIFWCVGIVANFIGCLMLIWLL